MASVRAATAQDAIACTEIVVGLDDYFTDDVPDTIDPLPDWPPGNPAAILAVALAATR